MAQEEVVKRKFEVKTRMGENGVLENAIFIDDEMLDWSVDLTSLMEAAKMGPKFFAEVQKDIEKHFVEYVSDFIGRKVTHDEIKQATKTGLI